MSTDGKWTASTREERWDSSEEFDTRDEALEYAKHWLAHEHDLQDGAHFFTGQIHAIASMDLAEYGADAEKVIDGIADRLYELLGDEVDHEFPVTPEQSADLDARLTAAIRDWIIAHKLEPKMFTLEHVTMHTFEQCEELQHDEANPDRCVLHVGHDGDHEWP